MVSPRSNCNNCQSTVYKVTFTAQCTGGAGGGSGTITVKSKGNLTPTFPITGDDGGDEVVLSLNH